MKSILRSVVVAAILLVLLACGQRGDAKPAPKKPVLGPGRRELNGITKYIQSGRQYNVFLIHFRNTGLDRVIGIYGDRQPVTFLMPVDLAFKNLPANIKSKLSGAKLVKLIQYHMLMEKWSIDFLSAPTYQANTRAFRTVLGTYIFALANPGKKAVVFNSARSAAVGTPAAVIGGDIGGKNRFLRFLAQGLNRVIIPAGVF